MLITGGAGFLGRGILRYIERNRIGARVTVYSRDENKQYALRSRFPNVRTVLGDIRDTERLSAVMSGHDTVIHAAALKHIPEAERDVAQTIAVDVEGSISVAQAALRANVRNLIGISTDKACSPRNAYGAAKMLMERSFQETQRLAPHMRVANVRYGNVVSSTGSVVPLFIDQLKRAGQISITSADMTRFWISIDDAVRLVEKALSDTSRHGYTYVAKCPGMRITDVAEAVIKYADFAAPGIDKPTFRYIGVRPGEKLHETLVDVYEAPYAMTDGDYILVPPALSMAGEAAGGVDLAYESSHPARWLGVQEMVDLIRDASEV